MTNIFITISIREFIENKIINGFSCLLNRTDAIKLDNEHEIYQSYKIFGGVWIMKNGYLGNFLDTGWYSESTLYYKGYIYWCEGYTSGINHTFFVDRWSADLSNDMLYHEYRTADGHLVDYDRVLEITGTDFDMLKKQFLTAPIFEGKTFWEIEKTIAWVDEGTPRLITDYDIRFDKFGEK